MESELCRKIRKDRRFQAGDRVRYHREFLKSTGKITGEIPRLWGTVESTDGPKGNSLQVAHVRWDNSKEIMNVLAYNLIGKDQHEPE